MICKVLRTAVLIRETVDPDSVVVNRTENVLKIPSGCRLTSYKNWSS